MYKSSKVPTLLILGLSVVTIGCEPDVNNTQQVSQSEIFDEAQSPSDQQLESIRVMVQQFMNEHHPSEGVQGFSFTSLTPNVYLVGVKVKNNEKGNEYTTNLTAERLRNIEQNDDEDEVITNDTVWAIDYADEARMDALADRHGFKNEVTRIAQSNTQGPYVNDHSGSNFLNNYLIWSMLFNRPNTIIYDYHGSRAGFVPTPRGYRYYAPQAPLAPATVKNSFGGLGGYRSWAFQSGIAKAPPTVKSAPSTAKPFGFSKAGSSSIASGKAFSSSAGRGGFGAAGHGFSSGG